MEKSSSLPKKVWEFLGDFAGGGVLKALFFNCFPNVVFCSTAPSDARPLVPLTKDNNTKRKLDNDFTQLAANRLKEKPDEYQNFIDDI